MKHWLSCHRLTIMVTTAADGRIIEAAPIARKFVGQHIDRLRSWMRSLGGFREEPLA